MAENTLSSADVIGEIAVAAIGIGLSLAGLPAIAAQSAPAVDMLEKLAVRLANAGVKASTTDELQALIDKVAALPDLATRAADVSADPGMTEREPEV